MATGVFGLRKVYIKQNENIDNRNFASWPESAVYGYFGGGYKPPSGPSRIAVNTIARLDFSNETLSNPGKNLPSARDFFATVSNVSYGYFGGGYGSPTTTYLCQIARLDYSNETLSLPGKNLPTNTITLSACSSSSYGYFGGGLSIPPPVRLCTITRLDFSSETISSPGKNLQTSVSNFTAVSSNSYGYFGGGFTGSIVNTISKLDFPNETVSLPGKNLPYSRYELKSVSSSYYGYFGGGITQLFPSLESTLISRLDFSTENTISLPPQASVYQKTGAIGSGVYGYFAGSGIFSSIARLDFTSEITSNPGINLPPLAGTTSAATLSGGQSIFRGSKTYGYIGGGVSPPPFTYFSEVRSIDFSNDSNTPIGSFSPVGLVPGGRWSQATLSSNYYGYFCGGQMPPGWFPGYFNTVTRIDFSNNTVTDPGRNFITDFRYAAGSSSNSYGFIVCGYNGVAMCSIQRMDFSSETFASTGQPNAFFTGNQASVSNSSYGYHVDSGTTYRLDFSTSGLSLPGKNTNLQVRINIAGFSNNRYGYFGGGYSPTFPGTYTSQMARLDFSTESYSSSTNLPVATSLHAGTSSNTHGYFIAGANPPGVARTTTVNKLDFGTEIFSPTTAIPSARSELSAMSNSN